MALSALQRAAKKEQEEKENRAQRPSTAAPTSSGATGKTSALQREAQREKQTYSANRTHSVTDYLNGLTVKNSNQTTAQTTYKDTDAYIRQQKQRLETVEKELVDAGKEYMGKNLWLMPGDNTLNPTDQKVSALRKEYDEIKESIRKAEAEANARNAELYTQNMAAGNGVDYIGEAKSAMQSNVYTGGAMSSADKQKRIGEIESRLDELKDLRNKARQKSVAGSRGYSSKMVSEAAEEYETYSKEITELENELKKLQMPEYSSKRDLLDIDIEAAQDKADRLQRKVLEYNGTYGGRALATASDAVKAQYKADVAAYDEAKAALDALKRQAEQIDTVNDWSDKTYDDTLTGQFKANYSMTDLSQQAAEAYNEYAKNPTQANREYAESMRVLVNRYQLLNEGTLDDDGAKLPWVTQTLAGYLPQLWEQTKAKIVPGAIGAGVGAFAGNPIQGYRVGAAAGSGYEMFGQVRGSAIMALVEGGMPIDTAVEAANDEAFISGLIESGWDYLTFGIGGGKSALESLGNAALKSNSKNAAVRAVAGMFGKASTDKLADKAIKEAGKSGARKVLDVVGGIGLQAGGEYLEEASQQAVSIANQNRDETGLWNLAKESLGVAADALTGKNPEALAEMHEAGTEGFKIGLMMGGVTTTTNRVISNIVNAKTTQQKNAEIDTVLKDKDTLDALITEGKELGGKSAVVATEIEEKAKKGSLKRSDVERLIASNQVYIEEAGNPEYDGAQDTIEALARETVAQEQKTAQRASSEARAASVGPVQPVTLEQRIKQRTGYGNEGVKAFASIMQETESGIDEVRPRFQRAYEMGLTGDKRPGNWKSNSIGTIAYEAGVKDAQSRPDAVPRNTAAHGKAGLDMSKSDTTGLPKGVTLADMPSDVTGWQKDFLNLLGKTTGTRIRIVKGLGTNGQITGNDVLLDADFDRVRGGKAITIVTHALHEIAGHRTAQLNPKGWQAFQDAVIRFNNQGLTANNITAAEDIHGIYNKAAQRDPKLKSAAINLEGAMEEVGADQIAALFEDDKKAAEFFTEVFNGKNEQAKEGARTFLQVLKDFVKRLKEMITGKKGKERAEMQETLDDTQSLIKLIEDATKGAVANVMEAQKNTTTEGGVRHALNEGFAVALDQWLKTTKPLDRMTSHGYFKLGTTSDALKSIGVKDTAVFWRKQKIGSIMLDHPEIDEATIKAVPGILENPIIVMKSQTRDDSIVLFGDVKAANGDTVMAALELTPKKGGGMQADFALLTSAYGRTDGSIGNLVDKSEILYLDTDKKRTDTWLMQLGVQFPSGQPEYGSIGSITYKDGVVNISGKTLVKLGGTYTKPTKTSHSLNASGGMKGRDGHFKESAPVEDIAEGVVAPKHSLKSWRETDIAQLRKALMAETGRSAKDVDKWINDVNGIAAMIAANRDILDYEADRNHTMVKPNAEYYFTLDASTLCAKRRLYQGTYNAIAKALGNEAILDEDTIRIRSLLSEHGHEAPCAICYVESRRKTLGRYAKEWLDSYDGVYKPTLDEVVTTDGLAKLRKEHPTAADAFIKAMNKKGTANPKVVETRTDYRGEIRKLTKKQVENVTRIGGFRIQSFSDFESPHLIDMMQAVMDMAHMKLTAQAYTKVPDFALAFGDTGIKINLSLIANGVDKNGRLILDPVEGVPVEEALRVRDMYSKDVGTIVVVRNESELKAALNDERIDFIIPFHRSGWSMAQTEQLGMTGAKDFSKWQNERDAKTRKSMKEGNLYPIDYWDYSKSGKANAQTYLDLCYEQGRIPKFEFLLDRQPGGRYTMKKDGSTDGYWKLLIDFKMYDNDGKGAPQRAVLPNFNMEESRRILNEYEGGANSLPVAQDVVDAFMKEKGETRGTFTGPETGESVRFSLRKKEPPKKTGIAYKVFFAKDGQLYPPMVANPGGAGTPVGVWLDADIGTQAAPSKTGRPQVKAGGKGTQGGSGSLAFRPGWHLGDLPVATQFARKNPATGKKELFPADFVWAECEYAMDHDYQDEAMSYGYTDNGKFRHSYAGLPKLPTDGYYRYRTNPNPDTVPWVITGAMKVNRILTDAETDKILRDAGVEPLKRQGGPLNLAKLGIKAGDIKSAETSGKEYDGNHTTDRGGKHSLKRDSEGRQLSEGQQQFFRNTKAVDESGNLLVVYHGTERGGFSEFKEDNDIGFYFSSTIDMARSYSGSEENITPKQISSWKDAQKLAAEVDMELKRVESGWELDNGWETTLFKPSELKKAVAEMMEEMPKKRGVYSVYLNVVNPLIVDGKGETWDNISHNSETVNTREIAREAKDNGHDGAIIRNVIDSGDHGKGHESGDVLVVFDSKQIKSVDNTDPTPDPDIRYSLKTDNEGNQLTVAQQEFFRDSKVRDYQGRLIKVYHTTTGDFTVFDKSKKGDMTSGENTYMGFFFSDAPDHMQNFPGFRDAKTQAYYLNIKNPFDMTDISKKAFVDLADVMGGDVDEATAVYDEMLAAEKQRAKVRGDNHTSLMLSSLLEEMTGDYYYADFFDELRPYYDELMARGYDGVVNFLDELTGTREYIVLESEQAKLVSNQNPTVDPDVRFSLKRGDDVLKENERLRRVNAELKSQFKRTTFAKVDKRSLDRFAKRLLKDYESGADINETRNALDELYTYMANGTDGNVPVWEDVHEMAYNVAVSILEDASTLNDEMYQEYKNLRDLVRTTGITINKEMYNHDLGYESINEFRKAHLGSIKLVNNGLPVDVFYSELSDRYPEFFNEDIHMTQPDQLTHIAEVLDSLRPVEENPYSHDMRGHASWLANDIIERFFELPQAKPTYADKVDRKMDAQRAKDRERLERERQRRREEVEKVLAETRVKIKALRQQEKAKRDAKVEALKAQHKATDTKSRENRKTRELRERIIRHVGELSQKLTENTNKKHVAEDLKPVVSKLLESINLESNFTFDPVTGKRISEKNHPRWRTEGVLTKRTAQFIKLKKVYSDILSNDDGEIVVHPELMGKFDKVIDMGDVRLADMNMEQLQVVWDVLRMVEHSVYTAGKMLSQSKYESTAEFAQAFKDSVFDRRVMNNNLLESLRLDMENPYTYFSRFGQAGMDVFRLLRDAQDDQATKVTELKQDYQKIVSPEIVYQHNHQVHEYTTEGGDKLTLTTAQIMDIYLLYKREQAQKHLLKGGIVQPEVRVKGKKVSRGTDPVKMNIADYSKLFKFLTDEQKIVADQLQKLTDKLGKWGNEAHMAAFGFRRFTEAHYWPIASAQEGIYQDVEKGKGRERNLRNMGAAKSTIPEASNALEVVDIYSKFDNHAAEMIDYASWLVPMEDLNRLVNFKFKDKTGAAAGSMKGLINRYGGGYAGKTDEGAHDAARYWLNLMRNIQNGLGGINDTAVESVVNRAISNVRGASVGANLRVVVQQPTAILRAATVLNPVDMAKGLKGGVTKGSGWKKALENAPIAMRKAFGSFDIGTTATLGDILHGDRRVWDIVKSKDIKGGVKWLNKVSMKGAAWADEVTWGRIWNACEWAVKREKPDLTGSAFDDAVSDKFTEVIDQTQVVDGVLQRSQVMRSGSALSKMATAFMGEPMMALNMAIRAYDAFVGENDPASRTRAKKVLARTLTVLAVTNAFNALAQSLVDGLRDDDDDKDYWERLLEAFTGVTGDEESAFEKATNAVLAGNLGAGLNPMGYVPYAKDLLSNLLGYTVERADSAIMADLIRASGDFIGSVNGDGKKTLAYSTKNLAQQVGKVFGISAPNILRDVWGVARSIAIETGNVALQYEMERAISRIENSNNKGTYLDLAYSAYRQGDKVTYDKIVRDLIDNGVEPSSIANGIKSRAKKDGISDASIGLMPMRPEADKDEDQFYVDDLNATQYLRYNEVYEDEVSDILGDFNRNGISRLDAETYNDLMSAAYKYASETALEGVSGGRYDSDTEWVNKAQESAHLGLTVGEYIMLMNEYGSAAIGADGVYDASKAGVAVETYLDLRRNTKDIRSYTYASGSKKGKSIENSSSFQKMKLIYDIPGLTASQREVLYDLLDVGKEARKFNKKAVEAKLAQMRRQAGL